MGIETFLRSAQKYIVKKENAIMTFDIKSQERYIKNLPEPIDDIQRSYLQYRCQRFLRPYWTFVGANVVSLLVLIGRLMKIFLGTNDSVTRKRKKNIAFFYGLDNPMSIIPRSIVNEFSEIVSDEAIERNYSAINKKYVIKIIKRYPLSWEFILKIVIKLGEYQGIIEKYYPQAIITPNEYSFTSSVLTDYCNHYGIEHIDVMHGEKLFFIRDSFFRFNRCYVWDEYYKDLLIDLRAEKSQFRIEVPVALKFEFAENVKKEIDFTYYLAAETEERMNEICRALTALKRTGKIIAVRPHPVYSDFLLVKKIFCNFVVEDVKSISVERSILRTRCAISLYSTCLQQAYYNGVNVVIDDISDGDKFSQLFQRRYIMINKGYMILSDCIDGKIR